MVFLGAMWAGAKIAVAVAWISSQTALIVTAASRPDGAFGFRMFSESSTIQVRLFRHIDGTGPVEVEGGEWTARDARGVLHRFTWGARVREPNLSTFGVTMHAAYGGAAQVQRWHAAIEDVAKHIPEDAETRALELELTIRKNGRAETVTHLLARR